MTVDPQLPVSKPGDNENKTPPPADEGNKFSIRRVLITLLVILAFSITGAKCYLSMPGKSHKGPLPPITAKQKSLAKTLESHVKTLSHTIGERNVFQYKNYMKALAYLEKEVKSYGYTSTRQTFDTRNKKTHNLVVEIPGSSQKDEIVVIGAHYDTVVGTPGANDNGTGTASLLAIAEKLSKLKPRRTLRFVFFANEEPPFFKKSNMGSLVYARACKKQGDKVVAMMSLETMGYYTDKPKTQRYPLPPLKYVYPTKGNYVGFIGNLASKPLVEQMVGTFRKNAKFPSEGAALPGQIAGVGWSDHWSFWQVGYPGVMVTDTAPFRYNYYHTANDTWDKINYPRLARVVEGLIPVIVELAEGKGRGKAESKKKK